ncbi:MAG: SIMPL domain-containing protein [Nocardioides sp.]|nr:SIMPL domain-containing protein [Nocardioides sp.]
MTEVVIDVRGSHTQSVPPERAVVHAEIRFDGPAPGPVMTSLRTRLDAVTKELDQLRESEAVERYVVQRVRTSAERPWRKDGKRLPLVHHAAVAVRSHWIDFDKLGAWVGRSSTVDGLTIDHVAWTLTDERRLALERDVRQEAVRQARIRAQDYADALDLGTVSVRRINDPGVGGIEREAYFPVDEARRGAAASAPELGFSPDDLDITAFVEASFVVTGG